MVTLKDYEYYAGLARQGNGLEMVCIAMNVKEDDRLAYLNYTEEHYKEWIEESHAINPVYLDDFEPRNYKNFISGVGFEPDIVREEYFALWAFSPPPVTYMTLNWNVAALGPFTQQARAGRALRNEAVFTKILPYSGIDRKSHAKFHGDTEEQAVDHPHSFVWYPVHEHVSDENSTIVAFMTAAMAWDTAMRNLIPEGVTGIHAVIKNTCGDVFTYLIDGPHATFQGYIDAHEESYHEMGLSLSLAVYDNPEYPTNPDHCQYSMVRDRTHIAVATQILWLIVVFIHFSGPLP